VDRLTKFEGSEWAIGELNSSLAHRQDKSPTPAQSQRLVCVEVQRQDGLW